MFGLDNYPRRNLCRSSSCLPATAITATSLVWRMRGLIHIHISDRTADILCYCQYEYWSTMWIGQATDTLAVFVMSYVGLKQ